MHAHDITTATTHRTAKAGAHRARWAAFGAAVAVSLGAGGLGIVSATAPDGASAYTPIDPCRLADTRVDGNVGPHNTPLGPDAVFTFDGWGDVPGDCNLPENTTGLQLNVTAVGATQLTNLRFYPAGGATPTVSNLNPSPGAPPTPNAVTVSLNDAGQFDVFNRFGNVDIVIDVAGYYGDHQHDGDDIINSSLTRVDIADEPGVSWARELNPNPFGATDLIVSTDLHAPASGHVTVEATAILEGTNGGLDQVSCTLSDGSTNENTAIETIWTEPANTAADSIVVTRSFPVSAAGEVTYSMLCQPIAGGGAIASQAFITATYVPTWRGDIEFAPFPVIDLPIVIIDQGM